MVSLKKLLKNVPIIDISGSLEIKIESFSDNSKQIKNNGLFIAIKGLTFDGHNYINNALTSGAIAIIYEDENWKQNNISIINSNPKCTFIRTDISRKVLAYISSNYYGNPANSMKIIGITGTNGKTSTSEIIYQFLKNSGMKTGLISTIQAKYNDISIDTGYHVTSPEAPQLHYYLSIMKKAKIEYLVLETTSHALDQYRVEGINFDVCGITNITPEHLDYHKTFESYIKAKAKIFSQSKYIFLNKYDPSINTLVDLVPPDKKYEIIDYRNYDIPKEYKNAYPGEYNMENYALARAIVEKILDSKLNNKINLLPITGRFETVYDKKFKIIIDFAHDAYSLRNVLKTAKKMTKGRLISVFGCAGLRDKNKRKLMGQFAQQYADIVVITAEDPRTEDIKDINLEIESGLREKGGLLNLNYFIIDDRQEAINIAVNKLAKTDDTILITGKGHERSMCFGTVEYPWSDHDAVKKAVSLLNRNKKN